MKEKIKEKDKIEFELHRLTKEQIKKGFIATVIYKGERFEPREIKTIIYWAYFGLKFHKPRERTNLHKLYEKLRKVVKK